MNKSVWYNNDPRLIQYFDVYQPSIYLILNTYNVFWQLCRQFKVYFECHQNKDICMYIAISNCYLIKDNFNIHGLIFLNKGLRFPTNFWPLRRFEAKKCLRQPLLARKVGLSCVITVTNSSQVVIGQRQSHKSDGWSLCARQ